MTIGGPNQFEHEQASLPDQGIAPHQANAEAAHSQEVRQAGPEKGWHQETARFAEPASRFMPAAWETQHYKASGDLELSGGAYANTLKMTSGELPDEVRARYESGKIVALHFLYGTGNISDIYLKGKALEDFLNTEQQA